MAFAELMENKSGLRYFLHVTRSLEIVPLVNSAAENVSKGLSSVHLLAPASLACRCDPHCCKVAAESLTVF